MLLPSTSAITDCAASHSLSARSATASSTGCTSVGELEITRRISLIAVCWSSASFVWLKRRTLSMAMAACRAKVCDQRDLVRREEARARDARAGSRRRPRPRASAAPRAPRGNSKLQHVRGRVRELRVEQRHDVGDVNRLAIDRRAAADGSPLERHRRSLQRGDRSRARHARRRARARRPRSACTRANGASQRCAARSATASSTGCTSVGELEITRRISLIAVCCSSEFCSSCVRSSTLRSRPAYDSRSCVVMRLNRSASPSSSSPVRTTIVWSRSPSPMRCAPSASVRMGRTMPRASASAQNAEITRPASSSSAVRRIDALSFA